MDRKLAAAVAILATLASSVRAGVHLTPSVGEYEIDGGKLKHLVFEGDNGQQITYSAPMGWIASGEEGKLTLRPPNTSQAEATVVSLPLAQPGGFDDATVASLRDAAVGLAPAGSEDVAVISTEKNPVRIGNKETVLVILSYTFFGQKYGRSVMFLNRGDEQLRFQFVSRLADFSALQKSFLQSQSTWQNL